MVVYKQRFQWWKFHRHLKLYIPYTENVFDRIITPSYQCSYILSIQLHIQYNNYNLV